MRPLHCPVEESLVVVVDIQPKFMAAIHEAERVVRRSMLLAQAAFRLDVPVIATEQNPERMQGLEPAFGSLLAASPLPKMEFSCWGAPGFQDAVDYHGRQSIVLVGIETHICVTLTALDLLNNGYRVFVCPDAVSARSQEMHKLGMERMRDSGVMPTHTDTLIYEWMGSAAHPRFRDVLELVKGAA